MAKTFNVSYTVADDEQPLDSSKESLHKLSNLHEAVLSGAGLGTTTVAWRNNQVAASAIVTCATVVSGNTVTINGQALTAAQRHATGTITITAAGVDTDDTVTIQGEVFTAKDAEDTDEGEFDKSGTDDAAATSLLACIQANATVMALMTATRSNNVITLRSIVTGTAGNAYTLVSSDAQLAVTGSGTLTNGAAESNNTFDYTGTNAQTAVKLAAAINASTTAIVNKHVTAEASGDTVIITAVFPGNAGNAVTLATSGGTLAITGGVARLTGGTEDTVVSYSL